MARPVALCPGRMVESQGELLQSSISTLGQCLCIFWDGSQEAVFCVFSSPGDSNVQPILRTIGFVCCFADFSVHGNHLGTVFTDSDSAGLG